MDQYFAANAVLSISLLKNLSLFHFIYPASILFVHYKTALSECGTILEEDDTQRILSGLIMSGSLNMNPAVVVIWVDGSCIHIKASAKEGLIKQHTAQKAIAAFKAAM